jgi:FADH2 O2-dependent halogenase
MRVLAARYGVPELKNLSNFRSIRENVAATTGVKRSFSFVYHREGQFNHPQECTQFPTFAPPLGPDMHYFRQDVDAYLFSLAVSYGAVCRTETRITDVQFVQDGVRLIAEGNGEGAGSFHAQYVVDAGGPGALIPRILDLREEPCPFETRSRAIFTHMMGVPLYEQMGPMYRTHGMATPVAQGTLHHVFEGGWMWIIPFGNHPLSTNTLCSVGLVLDLAEFPERDLSPEDEFWSVAGRFPGIIRQLREATPVRKWVRTSRLQFSSKSVIGERYCLMPHASDFVDPLFSSGLTVTAMAVNVLAHRLIEATRQKDFATERFEYVDTWVKRVFSYYDQLVRCSYIAFRDFELWNAWHRVWMVATLYSGNPMLQALVRFEKHRDPAVFEQLERYPYRGLQAIDYPQYWTLFTSAVSEVNAVHDQLLSPAEASRNIYRLLAESGLCPEPWQLLNPENRCPAGPATVASVLRLLLWGKHRAPEFVRQHYFDAGVNALRVFASDLCTSGIDEIRRATSGPWGYFRDGLVSQNRDWANKSSNGTNKDVSALDRRPSRPVARKGPA